MLWAAEGQGAAASTAKSRGGSWVQSELGAGCLCYVSMSPFPYLAGGHEEVLIASYRAGSCSSEVSSYLQGATLRLVGN